MRAVLGRDYIWPIGNFNLIGFYGAGQLLSYFLPHEGKNDITYGPIAFDTLAAQDAYQDTRGRNGYSGDRPRTIHQRQVNVG